ncbi:MAG: hypothetical protein J6K48_00045 [Lachnospiraceae bacterium]|nr:hypothetical protein [Lachnospiraceae bacterium]
MKLFLILFLCRELYMALMGLYLLKHKNVCNVAQWYGKICTTMIDAGVFILRFPGIPYQAANIIIIVMGIVSLLNYLFDAPLTSLQLVINGISILLFAAVCFLFSCPISILIFSRKEY